MDHAKLKERLKAKEAWRGHPYDDKTGKRIRAEGAVTIGYGWNLDANPLPPYVGEILLDIAVGHAVEDCRRAFPWFDKLNDVRQRVVVEMAYNMGLSSLLGFYRTLAAIEAGAWALAAHEMLDSQWAREVGARAFELAQMMESGRDVGE